VADFLMEPFPFINIENRPYPAVILGTDRYMGIINRPRHREEDVETFFQYLFHAVKVISVIFGIETEAEAEMISRIVRDVFSTDPE
jgi:hypothetical protein